MKYKFRKVSYSDSKIKPLYQYGIEALEEKLMPLEQIESSSWTTKEIQKIIDNC